MGFGYGNSKSNPLRGAKENRREVFKTDEIPHKWAHATQSQARNAQGNLYFRGDTIFSYRDSWPLARIYRRKLTRAAGCHVIPYSELSAIARALGL